MGFEVMAIGRLDVDLYPLQSGVALEDVESFGKLLGGTAGNMAVATARHSHRVALISRTGDDAAMGFEGGKMLVRIALDDPATARTLEQAGHADSELAERGLMAMLEPFISQGKDGRASNILTAEAVVKSAAIAAGLGVTSRHTWLKLLAADMVHG